MIYRYEIVVTQPTQVGNKYLIVLLCSLPLPVLEMSPLLAPLPMSLVVRSMRVDWAAPYTQIPNSVPVHTFANPYLL